MDFLQLAGRTVLLFGLANRKSVAWHTGRVLEEAGAHCVYVVHTPARAESVRSLVGARPVLVCDVARQEEIERLAAQVAERWPQIHGFVHSIAFADYSGGMRPFHETPRDKFLQAVDVSCFSLIALARALKPTIDPEQGSVVAVSISTTRMAAENYGFMAPAKAALDSSVCFLAKSFSAFSRVRFNTVGPGLLKTASSSGIPGYVDSYLHAERATLRRQGVQTEEAAHAIAFLLSPRASGINAQTIVVDAGMSVNYFDDAIIGRMPPPAPEPAPGPARASRTPEGS